MDVTMLLGLSYWEIRAFRHHQEESETPLTHATPLMPQLHNTIYYCFGFSQ
jgi:hypothetical protein